MTAECYPMSMLPHLSPLYEAYLAMGEEGGLARWYGGAPASNSWMGREVGGADAASLADALQAQSREFGAGPAALSNIEKLRSGARAVVTGQQVGLFGGPLLTLLKAANRRCASRRCHPHHRDRARPRLLACQ